MTLEVLTFRVEWDTPVSVKLTKGMRLFSPPPPSSGIIVAAIVGIMDQFNLTQYDGNKELSYHRFAEACKFVFAQRTLLGDWREEFGQRENIKKVRKVD